MKLRNSFIILLWRNSGGDGEWNFMLVWSPSRVLYLFKISSWVLPAAIIFPARKLRDPRSSQKMPRHSKMSPNPDILKNSFFVSDWGTWSFMAWNPVFRARMVAWICLFGVSNLVQIFPSSKTRKFFNMPPR